MKEETALLLLGLFIGWLTYPVGFLLIAAVAKVFETLHYWVVEAPRAAATQRRINAQLRRDQLQFEAEIRRDFQGRRFPKVRADEPWMTTPHVIGTGAETYTESLAKDQN